MCQEFFFHKPDKATCKKKFSNSYQLNLKSWVNLDKSMFKQKNIAVPT